MSHPDAEVTARTAEAVWCMLETQQNALQWTEWRFLDVHLARVAPVQRKTVQRRREGLVLLDTIRVFSPELVPGFLRKIDFTDLVQRLQSRGYSETNQNFIAACILYSQSEQAKEHSLF